MCPMGFVLSYYYYSVQFVRKNALGDETRLNMLIASMGGLFQLFFHAPLPRARIHNILSSDFAGSGFPGRDVFSDLERCKVLKLPGK